VYIQFPDKGVPLHGDAGIFPRLEKLIAKGLSNPPQPVKGCVDTRSIGEVLVSQEPEDAIISFKMPRGWDA
jgi:hypothetical protein